MSIIERFGHCCRFASLVTATREYERPAVFPSSFSFVVQLAEDGVRQKAPPSRRRARAAALERRRLLSGR
jgi:hypothetical protein